jgi:hypothetical protein
LNQLVILGPNDQVRLVWLRELALYASEFVDGIDEDEIRDGTAREVRQRLREHGIIVPRFFTFRALAKHRDSDASGS